MIWPHQYEALFWLGADYPTGATARDLFEGHYRHRPSYQAWSPRKLGNILKALRRVGLVEYDDQRVWALTLKGHAFLAGDLMDEALARLGGML